MTINSVPTAEVIDAMASRLRDSAKELDRLAARMRDTNDLELAGDAVNVIANLMPNLRLDSGDPASQGGKRKRLTRRKAYMARVGHV